MFVLKDYDKKKNHKDVEMKKCSQGKGARVEIKGDEDASRN